MRRFLLLTLIVLPLALCAGNFTITLQAPAYSGPVARLYRYDDIFTLRTVRIAEMPIGDDGTATLNTDLQGVTKMQLRIGDVSGDLFARPGTTLNILFPLP
ncbi:MAG: hypothetical protein ACK46C_10275, partial [Flavobacteriales bacterium]